ncbi:MAG: hypothetical protein WB495_21270, partial [Xanthobacteraceae bacterium]
MAGFVELKEESQHTDRFLLRVDHMAGGRMAEKPERVRLSVKRGTALPAGSFVEAKAARSAAAAARTWFLRFRARPLFPRHRRLWLRPRRDQDRLTPPQSQGVFARAAGHHSG